MSRAVPSTASSRARATLLAVAVGAACLWVFDLGVLRAGAPDPLDDTWEYGVVARHLLAGEGFRTRVIHPPLWTLRDARQSVPVLVHGPVVPVLEAPLVAAGGERALDRIAWLAAAIALATALLIARIGARQIDASAGAVAALAFTLAPATVRSVHHDLSLLLGAMLLALSLDLTWRPHPRALAAGFVIGLAALVRPEMLLAIPILALAVRRGGMRLLAVALVVLAPWVWHTERAVGMPFFNLSSYLAIGYWGPRPGLTVLRDFTLAPARWSRALIDALPTLPPKWSDFLPHALKRALLIPSGATGWLTVFGAASAWLTRSTRRDAVTALLLASIPILVMTLALYDTRYLVPFLPLWSLAAARGLRALTSRMPDWAHTGRLEIGAIALLMLPSTIPTVSEATRDSRRLEGRLVSERAALHALAADRDRVMFSDTPDFVAWSTGRPVVWMTEDEYRRLPGPGADSSGTRDRPVRGSGNETWFHPSSGSSGTLLWPRIEAPGVRATPA
jgi:hypothetical protein